MSRITVVTDLHFVHVEVILRSTVGKVIQSDEAIFFLQIYGYIQHAFYAHSSLNVYLTCILVSFYTVQMVVAEENCEKEIGLTAETVLQICFEVAPIILCHNMLLML